MDFPVFNVADIGVTCGFALLVIAYLVLERNSGAAEAESADGAEDAEAVEVADAPETSDASEGDRA
jgi:signal peptidase II